MLKQNTIILRQIEVAPNVTYAYGGLASIYTRQGFWDEALELADKSIKIDETYAYGYSVKGAVYYEFGEFEEAEKAYTTAYDLKPTAFSFSQIGYFQFLNGKTDLAMNTFEKRLRIIRW